MASASGPGELKAGSESAVALADPKRSRSLDQNVLWGMAASPPDGDRFAGRAGRSSHHFQPNILEPAVETVNAPPFDRPGAST
jgi:hypothetical protein